MATRKINKPVAERCLDTWSELGHYLTVARQKIIDCLNAGIDVSGDVEFYAALCGSFCRKGQTFFPEQFSQFCAQCDLGLPEPTQEVS